MASSLQQIANSATLNNDDVTNDILKFSFFSLKCQAVIL